MNLILAWLYEYSNSRITQSVQIWSHFVVFLNIHFYFERKIKSSSQAAAATATLGLLCWVEQQLKKQLKLLWVGYITKLFFNSFDFSWTTSWDRSCWLVCTDIRGALESHLASTAEGYRWGPGGLTIVLRVVESLVLTAFNLIKSLLQSFHSLFDEAPIRDQLLEHLEGVLGGAIGHLWGGLFAIHASGGVSAPLMVPFS